jgi:hypothetical protein
MSGSEPTKKPLLVVLAHESAQPTVDLFLPRWKTLDCDLVCALPCGDTVTGFDRCWHNGQSAHAGNKVFRRFADVCGMAAENGNEQIVIAEYDTVPLRPKMPPIKPGMITSGFYVSTPHYREVGDLQGLALSPWAMDRATLLSFIDAMDDALEVDPDGEQFDGLLDRWIAWAALRAGIQFHTTNQVFSYPMRPGAHEKIKRTGANWIHGWKTKEEFGDIWT